MDLSRTIAGLYEEKARLDRVIASLEQLGVNSFPVSITAARRGRRFMSPEERLKVSERMRKYWAGQGGGTAAAPSDCLKRSRTNGLILRGLLAKPMLISHERNRDLLLQFSRHPRSKLAWRQPPPARAGAWMSWVASKALG